MISSWSPRAWPRLSLTILKRSRSTNSIADLASVERIAQQLVGFGAEMKPVGKRGDRIVHAERMGILDRGAHLGEQACRPRRRAWAWSAGPLAGAGETRSPSSTASKPVAKRGQRAGAFAVGPLGGDVADQQAEGAGGERGEDLLVEFGEVEERGQREQERRKAGGARQDRVADLLGRACFHSAWCASRDGMIPPTRPR